MDSDTAQVGDVVNTAFGPAELISVYSRADGLRDGVLVDVTELAREAGFKWHTAVTAGVWALIEDIPAEHSYQDTTGRLWDVLVMLRASLAGRIGCTWLVPGRELLYRLVMHNTTVNTRDHMVELKAVTGPGDRAEPVLTIMLPDED
jgi:hypothetical protein